ncbi:MAG TPA: hypothetical protein VMD02_07400 [Candidatus Omnitrophota bacterium]|nr:hypothetical protein [Candidatus Omnitrophota bacterium]
MISNITPPAEYGVGRRALFNLGVRAYREPGSFKQAAFNLAADAIGIPLWMASTGYDFRGMRRDIMDALSGCRSIECRMPEDKLPSAIEIEKYFAADPSGPNRDCRKLVNAVKILDRKLDHPFIHKAAMSAMFFFSVMFAFAAANDLREAGILLDALPKYLMSAASARIGFHLLDGRGRTVRALLAFLACTDRELLIQYLPTVEVSWATQDAIYEVFYFTQKRDDELLAAIRRMPLNNYFDDYRGYR